MMKKYRIIKTKTSQKNSVYTIQVYNKGIFDLIFNGWHTLTDPFYFHYIPRLFNSIDEAKEYMEPNSIDSSQIVFNSNH